MSGITRAKIEEYINEAYSIWNNRQQIFDTRDGVIEIAKMLQREDHHEHESTKEELGLNE